MSHNCKKQRHNGKIKKLHCDIKLQLKEIVTIVKYKVQLQDMNRNYDTMKWQLCDVRFCDINHVVKYKVTIMRITIKRNKVRVKGYSCSFEMLSQVGRYKARLWHKIRFCDMKPHCEI